jgi:hypothetical protein
VAAGKHPQDRSVFFEERFTLLLKARNRVFVDNLELTAPEQYFVSDLRKQGFRVFWTTEYLYWKITVLMKVKRSYFLRYTEGKL